MKIDPEKKIRQLIEDEATRLSIAPEELLARLERPRFLVAAEEQAKLEGRSVTDILRRDLERIATSHYPTDDCLNPLEVEQAVRGAVDLLSDRQDHLTKCPFCTSMIRGAQLDSLNEEVQWLTAAVNGRRVSDEEESAMDERSRVTDYQV